MTRTEIKELSKQQLGGKIFGNLWMNGLLACLIVYVVTGAAGAVIPGLGAIILTGPITYGLSLVFLKLARGSGQIELGDIFKGFSDDFGGIFFIGLMTAIFTTLWSLLFVIPGIVKSYSYSMAYYIKIDHPDYNWSLCIKESRYIMAGHKGELFIQDLSFIGWFIVGSLCLGVGTLWVMPYYMAARANFYDSIKDIPTAAY